MHVHVNVPFASAWDARFQMLSFLFFRLLFSRSESLTWPYRILLSLFRACLECVDWWLCYYSALNDQAISQKRREGQSDALGFLNGFPGSTDTHGKPGGLGELETAQSAWNSSKLSQAMKLLHFARGGGALTLLASTLRDFLPGSSWEVL